MFAQQAKGFFGGVIGPADGVEVEFLAADRTEVQVHFRLGRNAGYHDAAGASRHVEALIDCARLAGAIKHHVDAAFGCIGQHCGHRVDRRRIDNRVRAHALRHRPPLRDGINAPYPAGTRQFQPGDGKQTDGTGADHSDRFTGTDGGKAQRVENDGERLKERRLPQTQRLWKRQQVLRRQVHILTKETRHTRGTEELDILANIVVARGAEFAVVAVDGRFQHRKISRRPSGDACADLCQFTGWFMTKDRWIDCRGASDSALRKVVQIGPADSDGADSRLHFPWAGIGNGGFHHSEFSVLVEFSDFHHGGQ